MNSGELYPQLEPFFTGTLPVSDGHQLYYEVSGNPDGQPVIFLHGGPGSGCKPQHRRFFDPTSYRIILFDQRGSGRSTPTASIENNTTQHLIADIEAIRQHLGIDEWVVFGGSWGSTLALAYGIAHPNRCRAFVLRGIWLCRPSDIDWAVRDVRIFFPDSCDQFEKSIPFEERDNLTEAYFRRLTDPDPQVHMPAAVAWKNFELFRSTLVPTLAVPISGNEQVLAMSRIMSHYMRHLCFLGAKPLLDAVHVLRRIPCVIIHGRYDMVCRIEGAFALAKAWPEAEFEIIPDAGHSAMEPGTCLKLCAATDRFRHRAT